MTNLLACLPDLDITPFTHILPSLEKAAISVADILSLNSIDVAKRANVPPGEVKKLADVVLDGLHADINRSKTRLLDGLGRDKGAIKPPKIDHDVTSSSTYISTLDDRLDSLFHGGIGASYLTEVVGER